MTIKLVVYGARPAGEVRCFCSATHYPDPTELHAHHILPLYLGGDDVVENLVWLCPTGHANVHEMIRLMMKVGRLTFGEMQDSFPQRLNRYLYNMATTGFDLHTAA